MRLRQTWIWLSLLLSLLLAGCGFRLRGSYLLPEQLSTLYVQSHDEYSEVSQQLKRLLKANNTQLLSQASPEYPVVQLQGDKLDRRTLSIFSNGQVAEYELIYSVEYALRLPQQDATKQKVEIYRNYQDDPDAALAKSKELELIINEMRQQAADRIMRQLAATSQ